MKSWFWWVLGALGGTALLVGGVFLFLIMSDISSKQQKVTKEQESTMKEVNEPTEQKEIVAVSEDGIPTEDLFQQEIHEMTHQKVRATEKWGSQQITPEQIDHLLGVLASIEGSDRQYEHFEFYLNTLEAWDSGDFSNAVEVHNTIWKWNGGSIGRATGLMDESEEQEYIEANFE